MEEYSNFDIDNKIRNISLIRVLFLSALLSAHNLAGCP